MEGFGRDLARVLPRTGDVESATKRDNNTSKETTQAYGRPLTQQPGTTKIPRGSGEVASASVIGRRAVVTGDNKTPEKQLNDCLETLKEKYQVDFPGLGKILGEIPYNSRIISDSFDNIVDPLRISKNIFDNKLYDLYNFLKHDIEAFRTELASLLIVILFVWNESKEGVTAQTVINDVKTQINNEYGKNGWYEKKLKHFWQQVSKDSDMALSGLKFADIPGATISAEYANRLTEYNERYSFPFKELVDRLPDTFVFYGQLQCRPILNILDDLKDMCGTEINKKEINRFKTEFFNNYEMISWLKGKKKSFRDKNACFVLLVMDIMERKFCIGQLENSECMIKAKSAKDEVLKEFKDLLRGRFNGLLLRRISSIINGK